MSLPNEPITPIPNTDPDAVPSLWNTRYVEIDENFANLNSRAEAVENELETAMGSEETFSARFLAVVNEVVSVGDRVGDIELDSAQAVSDAVRLDWLYRNLRMAVELWTPNWTLLDDINLTVVQAVAGDNSVDVDATANLVVDQEYVIDDGTNRESLVVEEILSATRFTATTNLVNSFSAGAVTRSNFTIENGIATALAGRLYFCGPMDLGSEDTDKAVIIRRDDNDTLMRIFFKDSSHEAWTEATWEWQRNVETGIIDVEYRVPARGELDIKIAIEAGSATSEVDIHHIVGVHADTSLEGTHHPPEMPVNSSPADTAEGVTETPTISVASYASVVGSSLWASQLQVTTVSEDYTTPVYDSGTSIPGALGMPVAAGLLVENTAYYWRMRLQDTEGAWSEWSAETSFTTNASFEYVNTPVNQSPGAGAVDISEQPSLSSSPFDTTDFSLISLSDGATDKWTDSPATTGEYYFSAAGGPTNKPIGVYANSALLSEGTLGSLSNDEWAWGDQDTIGSDRIYVKLAIGDPDAQIEDYIQCSESHTVSQWQIRTAIGDYSTPLYDSGESTDLESHIVPIGNLEEGESDYFFRVRHEGENIGFSEWSSESRFTTKNVFANIVGIAMVSSGGGAGVFQRIDEDGNNKTTDAAFFNNHPVFGDISNVTIDSQAMVKIPKFYAKQGTVAAGADQAGKKAWWVSDQPVSGFSLESAFMDGGVELDQFYYGAYEATNDGGTKAGSATGVAPLVSIDFPTMQTRCTARNTGGVDGFHMANIHELSAIQLLILIENGGPDVQSTIGIGNTASSAAVNTGASNAVWRGIYELWGNVNCMIDGLQFDTANQIKVFDQNGNGTYVATGVTASTTDAWITGLHENIGTGFDLRTLFIGETFDATESNGSFGDYQYSPDSAENNVCHHGGGWGYGSQAGLFCLHLVNDASDSRPDDGSRLAKV